MALKGNLDDFNIANILQMIKLEGKTGRLNLTDTDDLVRITFDAGNIIYAEGPPLKDDNRIKMTLVSGGFIKLEEWATVENEHERRLVPYWDLLSSKISASVINEMINRQTLDTVYHALRWKKGSYEFTPMKSISYNPKAMSPKDVEAMLMEGCRIGDEWGRVMTSLPPLDTFITKNIVDEDEELDPKQQNQTGDYKNSLEYEILNARGITINDRQAEALSAIGAGKTIRELMDSARQGHFETLEAVQALLRLGIVKTSRKKKKAVISADHTGGSSQFLTVALLLAIIGGGVFWQLSILPRDKAIKTAGIIKVNRELALAGMEKIEKAMRTNLAATGSFPKSLNDLIPAGALQMADLIDPWNNKYQLMINQKSFALFSLGPDPGLSADNIYLDTE